MWHGDMTKHRNTEQSVFVLAIIIYDTTKWQLPTDAISWRTLMRQ